MATSIATAVLSSALVLSLVACEPIPELRGTSDTPTPASSDDGVEKEVATILNPEDSPDGSAGDASAPATDAGDAAPSSPYDRVCQNPNASSFCCGGGVLCGGKKKKCEAACASCTATCAGHLCCILEPSGRVERCSDTQAECAGAIAAN